MTICSLLIDLRTTVRIWAFLNTSWRSGGGCVVQLQMLATLLSPAQGLHGVEVATVIAPLKCCMCLSLFLISPRSFCPPSSRPLPTTLKGKSLSKWVIFLEMLIRFFRECASSAGACPLWLLPTSFLLRSPSLIDYFLVVFLSHRLSLRPSSPHFSLSLIVFLLFCLFFPVLCWCQVLCDNSRLMGINKKGCERWEKAPTSPGTSPIFSGVE